MQLLHKVVMNQWQRFDEIEVIALMEANRILGRSQILNLNSQILDQKSQFPNLKLQIANPFPKFLHLPLPPPNLLGQPLTTEPQPSRQCRPPGLDRPTKIHP